MVYYSGLEHIFLWVC